MARIGGVADLAGVAGVAGVAFTTAFTTGTRATCNGVKRGLSTTCAT